jgi:ABC-type transport system involved in multi-copper enzyme maturation permease subunit
VRGAGVVAVHALQEALRRRVFLVVLALTVVFLGLFWLGAWKAFEEAENQASPVLGVDTDTVVGSTLFGLAMFGTLFLGVVLGVFLTLGAVRGDAERGLLQPLVVRPLGRPAFLAGRLLGAVAVCVPYVFAVYALAAVITRSAGGWWPDQFVAPGLELAGAATMLAALSLLGSVVLSSTANGIAVFMLYGAGLVAGLLGQIGEALGSDTLRSVADTTAWFLPFEALYQDALHRITADTHGLTEFVVELGPFGGAQPASAGQLAWTAAYLALVAAAAAAAFARRDL